MESCRHPLHSYRVHIVRERSINFMYIFEFRETKTQKFVQFGLTYVYMEFSYLKNCRIKKKNSQNEFPYGNPLVIDKVYVDGSYELFISGLLPTAAAPIDSLKLDPSFPLILAALADWISYSRFGFLLTIFL